MVKPNPLPVKRTVKRTRRFWRFQSDLFHKVPTSWRKPHGIDNRVRRRFKGTLPMPSIGYGTDKRVKYVLPNGFKPFLVRCPQDLEILLMHNRNYCAVLAKQLSSKTRKVLLERAAQLNVRVLNAGAKVRTEEHE